MSADWEMRFPLDMIPAQLEAATPLILARAAEGLRAIAVTRTPSDTGHLRGETGVTAEFKAVEVIGVGVNAVAELKFPGPYAAFQNRGMRADGTHVIRNRPHGGQTGFLTETMRDSKQVALDIIADSVWQLLGAD